MTAEIKNLIAADHSDISGALRLAMVTPARNEAAFIEETLKAVIAQSVRPTQWVIVSDGSTDGTDEIVKSYAARHKWIVHLRLPDRTERHFAGKVYAFNAGYELLKDVEYDIIGNLDADTTFDSDQFAFLLDRFSRNSRLGVAGTAFVEGAHRYNYRFTSSSHVSGCCQLFRRECFEAIGGYVPIKIGGIDLVAVLTARLVGWETRTFPEKVATHHRKVGTAKQSQLMVAFRGGKGDYMLGTHPLWEACRTPYQMTMRPYVLAGVLRLAGFTIAMVTRSPKLVSDELLKFRRAEQMGRLRAFISNLLSFHGHQTADASGIQVRK
jgi:biofilm PGA synthesis N-glycosyltransferase PgaC